MNFLSRHQPGSNRRALLWLVLILTIVAAIRIRLVNMPLERDEGELAYAGQLLLQGVSPYQGAYIVAMKPPGTCATYALAMELMGENAIAIRVTVILITLATAIFIFLLTRRICGNGAGAFASATYALLSISPPSLGLAAHATHFVMLPAVAGIFLLQNLDERSRAPRIFLAGLLLGLAILMKQTGAAFGLFAALWIVHQELRLKEKLSRRLATRLGWLAGGGCLPLLLAGALIVLTGDWPQFWLWSVKYAAAHSAIITFTKGLETAAGVAAQLFMAAPTLWSLALAGLVLLLCAPVMRRWRFFVAGFVCFSLAAVYPGWRGHYFIQLFPALGLLAGVAFQASWSLLERLKLSFSPQAILLPVVVVALASPLLQWSSIYFTLTPAEVSRAIYGTNLFIETERIGFFLAQHCPPDRRMAVLGSEPEIYFYSHRRAATGHIDTYPLMEPQPYAVQMQQEMIRQIENANPDYVVFVHVPVSWLQYSDSKTLIFDWFQKYQRQQLRLIGLVELPPDGPAIYHWFEGDQKNVQTTAESWLAIFQRK